MTAVAASTGAAAPSAMAADDCPNAKVRAQQFRGKETHNCFAYERVTPNDKNGSNALADSPVTDDGNTISVWASVHLFDDDDSGHQNVGIANREADGWKIRIQSNTPLWAQQRATDLFDGVEPRAWSPDLQDLVFMTKHPIAALDRGENLMSRDFYLSSGPDNEMTWITAPVSGSVAPSVSAGSDPVFLKASSDVRTVDFSTSRVIDPALDASVRNHVWRWTEGGRTVALDYLPNGNLSTTTTAALVSNDQSALVFESSDLHGSTQVYLRTGLDTANPQTRLISSDAAGNPCPSTATLGWVREDLSRAAYLCTTALFPEAPSYGGFYVKNLATGAISFSSSFPVSGGEEFAAFRDLSGTWIRPDGRYGIRSAQHADFNGNMPGNQQRTIFDPATGVGRCVTCNADGTAAPDHVNGGGIGTGPGGGRGMSFVNAVTADGEFFFQSKSRYVPEDTNNSYDIYMWKDGKHYLLSSGVATTNSYLGGVSADGSTVSFSTSTSLVPEDRDGGEQDIYVLRRNGGFYREPAAAPCAANCQGPAAAPGPLLAPLSVAFPPAGDVVDSSLDDITVSGSRTVTGTSLKVKVRVPAGGRASVSGNGLRSVSRSVSRASTVTLNVKLSDASKRTLRGKRSIKRTATVRYAPTSGATQSKRVSLTFKRKVAKKKASSRGVASASNGKAAR